MGIALFASIFPIPHPVDARASDARVVAAFFAATP